MVCINHLVKKSMSCTGECVFIKEHFYPMFQQKPLHFWINPGLTKSKRRKSYIDDKNILSKEEQEVNTILNKHDVTRQSNLFEDPSKDTAESVIP